MYQPDFFQPAAPATMDEPYGSLINQTGSTAGSPIDSEIVNDIYYALLAVLVSANIAPSNQQETASNSQFLQALQAVVGAAAQAAVQASNTGAPIGAIAPYSGYVDPTDLPDVPNVPLANSWIVCDGRQLPQAQYGALFNVFGGTYNGSQTIQPGYFAIPDLRGLFVRGQSDFETASSAPTKPATNGSSAAVGVVQPDQMQGHTHLYNNSSQAGGLLGQSTNPNLGGNNNASTGPAVPSAGNLVTGAETRPVNMGLNYIIRVS